MSFLIRSILLRTTRRFVGTAGSSPQGCQDDASMVANCTPDFTSTQGLQGDLLNSNGKDAICNLWLQKCKLYGYDDCEERLQKLLDSSAIKKN